MDAILEQDQEIPVRELIERFERDMLYDCHGYVLRFSRSQARKELVRRGKKTLKPIAEHLRVHPPGSGMGLDTAWGNLLCLIGTSLPVEDGPKLFNDTRGWIEWAERTDQILVE